MISFFLLSLPIFAVIGVGWVATRTRLVSQGALDGTDLLDARLDYFRIADITGQS